MPIPENSEEPLMGFKEGAQRSHNTFTFQKGNSGFLVGRSWRGTKRDAVGPDGRLGPEPSPSDMVVTDAEIFQERIPDFHQPRALCPFFRALDPEGDAPLVGPPGNKISTWR